MVLKINQLDNKTFWYKKISQLLKKIYVEIQFKIFHRYEAVGFMVADVSYHLRSYYLQTYGELLFWSQPDWWLNYVQKLLCFSPLCSIVETILIIVVRAYLIIPGATVLMAVKWFYTRLLKSFQTSPWK